MTNEDLAALLRAGEGQQIDFQPENVQPARLAETLMALANASGGYVCLGVEGRPARVTGLADPVDARDRALQAALLCEPPLILPLPQVLSIEDKLILLIMVPPGLPHVYSLKGRYLWRVGSQNKPMVAAELRRLLSERGEVSFEDEPASGATLADLNWTKVERYVNSLDSMGELSPKEILVKRGCLTANEQPTHAGILLFGQEPWRFIHGCDVIVVRYAGTEMGDTYLREDIRDTLPEQIRRAEAFVVSNMRVGARLSGLERHERAEYPRDAVREAIVNAVAHRDYSIRGQEIRVFMFADRIEVYSPGRLPGPVTVDNIREERFSRNETIVQVLSDMGFIERLGYGIDRMIRLMAEEGLPPPVFRETAAGFQVTLYGHGERLVVAERTMRPSQWAHLGLNERQERAMRFLTERGRITNRDLQELYPDVSPETIRRDLADLVDRNLLLKIGDKKATYYIFK